MSKPYHEHLCGLCIETFECCSEFNCPASKCRDCRHAMDDLQPAARRIIEILLKRLELLAKELHES